MRRKLAVWSVSADRRRAAMFRRATDLAAPAPNVSEGTNGSNPPASSRRRVSSRTLRRAAGEGEFVRVVHTEVAPDTLTRMGVFIATASGDSIPVDLVVGQDDAPLAVRVDDENEENSSSENLDPQNLHKETP